MRVELISHAQDLHYEASPQCSWSAGHEDEPGLVAMYELEHPRWFTAEARVSPDGVVRAIAARIQQVEVSTYPVQEVSDIKLNAYA